IAWLAVSLAASATLAVVVERALQGLRQVRQRRLEQRYMPIVRRALVGDAAAERALVDCPRRDRIDVAVLLVTPLIDDRDSWRIARTREIFTTMSLVAEADRFLDSRLWWRRAIARPYRPHRRRARRRQHRRARGGAGRARGSARPRVAPGPGRAPPRPHAAVRPPRQRPLGVRLRGGAAAGGAIDARHHPPRRLRAGAERVRHGSVA